MMIRKCMIERHGVLEISLEGHFIGDGDPTKPRNLVHGFDRRVGLTWAADSLSNVEAENES